MRGNDNALWHRWSPDGQNWSPWESLGGVLTAGPAAVAAAVRHVCDRRRDEILRVGLPVEAVDANLAGGRILSFDFETDLCGAAPVSSGSGSPSFCKNTLDILAS